MPLLGMVAELSSVCYHPRREEMYSIKQRIVLLPSKKRRDVLHNDVTN
jgi:hypothetical protein